MSTDKAQELTEQINNSITALCAETDAAKQSATYRAWLSTVSRFLNTRLVIAFSSGRRLQRLRASLASIRGSLLAVS
jgi:hypothetical protein